MSPVEVYREAARRGLTLKQEGSDKLAVIPTRLCSLEFADTLRAHKTALLALLADTKTTSRPEAVTPHRPLTLRELLLLRRANMVNNPLIIAAINLFDGTIAEVKSAR